MVHALNVPVLVTHSFPLTLKIFLGGQVRSRFRTVNNGNQRLFVRHGFVAERLRQVSWCIHDWGVPPKFKVTSKQLAAHAYTFSLKVANFNLIKLPWCNDMSTNFDEK